MAKTYEVTIPAGARRAFGGASRLQRRFKTMAAARVWRSQIKTRIAHALAGVELESVGAVATVVPNVPSFKEAAQTWLEERPLKLGRKSSYWARRVTILNGSLGDLPVTDIGVSTWSDYVKVRRCEGASDDALGRERKALLGILKRAAATGIRIKSNVLKIKPIRPEPGVQRTFDPEVLEAALEVLAAHKPYKSAAKGRDHSIIQIAALSGMRAGELRAFNCSWIRWHEGRIVVPHSREFSPKSARSRSIPLHPLLQSALESWLGSRRTGQVWPSIHPGRPRTKRSTWTPGFDPETLIKRVRAITGWNLNGLHDLRVHSASWMASKGVPIRLIQEILGHKSVSTTEAYMKVSATYWRDAYEKLAPSKLPAEFPAPAVSSVSGESCGSAPEVGGRTKS